ncbi:cytochrome P450 [Trametes meyenii]|nr:cytochrome P450 [Trametes meyenii]
MHTTTLTLTMVLPLSSLLSTPCMLSVAILLYIACSIARWLSDRKADKACLRHIPCAPHKIAHWLWGHELLTFEGQATETYTKWAALCGAFFRVKAAFFRRDIIVVADHAAVRHIFSKVDDYVKAPTFRPIIENILGKGLVWAEGDDHKAQRSIISPAFSHQAIEGMVDHIAECSDKFLNRLVTEVVAAGGTTIMDINQYTSIFTLDVIGRVAFDHDFKSGESVEAQEIHASWEGQVNAGLGFSGFIAMLLLRMLPFAPSVLSKLPARSSRSSRRIRDIATKVATRLLQSSAIDEKGRDIMSLLVRAKHRGKGLTREQIVDNIGTFIVVGHETTAGSLSFILLELARNPDIQERLRDEINKFGGKLGYHEIQQLQFLDAVVKEGLRLHPAAPQTERVALKDDVIPLSTPITTTSGEKLASVSVRAGQVFHIPFTTIHVNPDVWGESAAQFDPARWLKPDGVPPAHKLPSSWSGLLTFCDGPRNCIGYRLAVCEIKFMLATLVRELKFQATDSQIVEKISPTLQPVVDGRGGYLPLRISFVS